MADVVKAPPSMPSAQALAKKDAPDPSGLVAVKVTGPGCVSVMVDGDHKWLEPGSEAIIKRADAESVGAAVSIL